MSTEMEYAAAQTITFSSLNSLGSSSTFVAGAESLHISNDSDLFIDALVTGTIFVGTTPTINTAIIVYAFAAMDETPTWPDVLDGTDSVETLTSVGVGQGFLKRAAPLYVDSTTSDRGYPFSFGVAELFNNIMPRYWGLFVTHNTGVNLKSSSHLVEYQGIKFSG